MKTMRILLLLALCGCSESADSPEGDDPRWGEGAEIARELPTSPQVSSIQRSSPSEYKEPPHPSVQAGAPEVLCDGIDQDNDGADSCDTDGDGHVEYYAPGPPGNRRAVIPF